MCAVLTGCADDGVDLRHDTQDQRIPVSPNDAAGEGASPEEIAPAEARDIPGTSTVFVMNTERFFTSVGVAVRGRDMSANPPEIHVLHGNTFTRITGTPYGGGYRFFNVPEREYYLKTGWSFIITDERRVEIGRNRLGRSDAVATAHSNIPVELGLTNLAPWNASNTFPGGSRLQLVSSEQDVSGEVVLQDLVAQGATSLSTTNAYAYTFTGNLPVFEAAKGDDLYVNQISGVPHGLLPNGQVLMADTIVRSMNVPALDYTADGVTPLILNGAMQEVPLSNVSLEWRLGDYPALAPSVHPNAIPRGPTLFIDASAHGPEEGWVSYSGEVFLAMLPTGASFTFAHNLTYGNPYPSNWRLVGTARYPYLNMEVLPGIGGVPRHTTASISTTDYLEDLVTSPITPTLTPPQALAIDGIPATSQRVVGNSSPVISWQPPANGAPTAYQVNLTHYDPTYSTMVTKNVFYLPGTETEVRLPPGILTTNSIYRVVVTAIDSPHFEVTRAPFQTSDKLPKTSASTMSSFFSTP
ncbi:hypothetical protein GCM10012319_58090 [Comamonas sp. KCTC 72670]|nr:hypothetical protein GCM10012319_58090 [Comamonas sp. KCTC 72670]